MNISAGDTNHQMLLTGRGERKRDIARRGFADVSCPQKAQAAQKTANPILEIPAQLIMEIAGEFGGMCYQTDTIQSIAGKHRMQTKSHADLLHCPPCRPLAALFRHQLAPG
jgi:hypothetical protein